MVNALDDIPFSEHDLVPKWHQFVLHVVSDSSGQMYSVGKERIKQARTDVYLFVSSTTSCRICTNSIMYFSNLHTSAIVLRSEKWLFNSFKVWL